MLSGKRTRLHRSSKFKQFKNKLFYSFRLRKHINYFMVYKLFVLSSMGKIIIIVVLLNLGVQLIVIGLLIIFQA